MRTHRGLLATFLIANGAVSAAVPDARMPVEPQPRQAITCSKDAGWDEPMPPRHVFGNVWFVGTCGISSVLLASPHGHVLIDGGAKLGAERIETNLRALGVDVRDIKYILVSHEHFDHVGGVAQLQRDSGAVVLTRQEALATLKRGVNDRRDPQYEVLERFPAIAGVQAIKPEGVLRVGDRRIQNVPMPGHTPGGSGWRWRECEGRTCLDLFYSDSVSAISDRKYHYGAPGALAKPLRQSLRRLGNARCDVLMTTHPSGSHLIERLDGKAPLVQSSACRKLAETASVALDKRLADEVAGKAP